MDGAVTVTTRKDQPAADPQLRAQNAFYIARAVQRIDALLSEVLDRVLHHPKFADLEGRWRGLQTLVRVQSECKNTADPFMASREKSARPRTLQLRMLNCSWQTLSNDLRRVSRFTQSALFTILNNQYFDYPGAAPFGMLAIDHDALGHGEPGGVARGDVECLMQLSGVGAATFCPIVLNAGPGILDLERWSDLPRHTNMSRISAQAKGFTELKRLFARPDSAFLGLIAPRLLARPRWREIDLRCGFRYEESWIDRSNRRRPLAPLTGGVFAMAATAMRAFDEAGWFAHIRGAPRNRESGGLIPRHGVDWFDTDRPGIARIPPVELTITEALESDFARHGMIPITHLRDTERLAFYALPSLRVPGLYADEDAQANARLSAMFQFVLSACRVGHCVKVMMRDNVGSFKTRDALEKQLSDWLLKLCVQNEENPKTPLRARKVELEEGATTGNYKCKIKLHPHYMLDRFSMPLELVTNVVVGEQPR